MNPINPPYLYEGQIVYIRPILAGIKGTKPGTGLRCKVEMAFGDAGILSNEERNFRELVSRWDMWVIPKG